MSLNENPRRSAVAGRVAAVLVASAVGWWAAVSPAHAIETTILASKDNTMFEEDDGLSNGAGDHFFTGQTDNGVNRRALIAFDVASAVPPGSTVNSVVLTLFDSRGRNGTWDISLHRVLADWGEGTSDASGQEGEGAPATTGDATWSHTFYPSSFWSSAGGDFVATASATTPVGNEGYYSWSSTLMRDDVQGWVNSGDNFGWIIIGDETTNRTARRFDSRTNGDVSRRPELTIDFTPQETVGACCLPNDDCVVVSETDCLAQGGVYQGDEEPCTPDPCTVATGACCFDDGTCNELTEADCLAQSGTYQGDDTACTPDLCELVLEPFVDALPIPGVAVPTSGNSGGVATYDIEMQQVTQQLHRDLPPTTVWGYEGGTPGPVIEASTGNPVTVNWINDLRNADGTLRTEHYLPVDLCMHGPDHEGPTPRTVVHLHGGHVPADVDGYPEDTFLPGQQVQYVYPNQQQAAPLWFHDHALGITRLNVMMGLAGLYNLRDDVESALNIPDGVYEIPLVIQDRRFNADGNLRYPADWEDHFFGDKIVVNGKVWPFLDVDQGKYRFRLVNGSNSRVYTLKLSNGDPFLVIGNDGGLLPAPVPVDSLTMTPGERYDTIVDFAPYAPGTEIILENSAAAPFPGNEGVIPDVMKFVVQSSGGFTDPVPTELRPVEPLDPADAIEERDFFLEKQDDECAGSIWKINGLLWDDITEYPVRGTTEIWRFINDSGVVHPMHMHLVFFQILDRQPFTIVADTVQVIGDPIPPEPHEAGWKDTAPVNPGEVLRVIARFDDYLGKYAYHCHILEHEDHEMMRQFQVIDAVDVPDVGDVFGLFLSQNRPNPFNPATTVSFHLPGRDHVGLRVFDVGGRLIEVLVDEVRDAGDHYVVWRTDRPEGPEVAAGVYFIELESAGTRTVKRATVVR